MNSKQYSNIILWTLKHEVEQFSDSFYTARTIFKNMGIALPHGTKEEIFKIIDTSRYMWWRAISAEEAQQTADMGNATIGLNSSEIIIILPTDAELKFDKKRHSSVVTMADFDASYIISNYKFFAHGLTRKEPAKVFYSSNNLDKDQMHLNAQYVFDYYKNRCWTKNAICAMLGNMQSESGINPAFWNNKDASDSKIGLVQWSPQTDITDWVPACADPKGMNLQLKRILYELYMGLKWQPTQNFPMSFGEFTRSTRPSFYLARVFMNNYIKSADNPAEAQKRAAQAMYWFNALK